MNEPAFVVHLFAAAREAAGGAARVRVAAGGVQTVAELRVALVAACPALAPLLPNCLIAVNEDYAGDDCVIRPQDEIAVIPPVSGG